MHDGAQIPVFDAAFKTGCDIACASMAAIPACSPLGMAHRVRLHVIQNK